LHEHATAFVLLLERTGIAPVVTEQGSMPPGMNWTKDVNDAANLNTGNYSVPKMQLWRLNNSTK